MENETEAKSSGTLLKDPIRLKDLLDGTSFEINADMGNDELSHDFDELSLNQPGDNVIDKSDILSPWTKTFDELRQNMEKIDEFMYKKVVIPGDPGKHLINRNTLVHTRYNAYWEGEDVPFDSSYLRGKSHKFFVGNGNVLEGFDAAILTMRVGEKSQFLISYHLLFKELGCPPRIKPRADALFNIEIVACDEVGEINEDKELTEAELRNFEIVIEIVKSIILKGLNYFKKDSMSDAARSFRTAIDMLNYCELKNSEEEKSRTEYLIRLYTNLAVTYLKLENPRKTVEMCGKIRRLTDNKPSCKALFQEGRAYFHLGDFKMAVKLLVEAQQMELYNVDINNELKKLNDAYGRYKNDSKLICQKAIGVIAPAAPAAAAAAVAPAPEPTAGPATQEKREKADPLKKKYYGSNNRR